MATAVSPTQDAGALVFADTYEEDEEEYADEKEEAEEAEAPAGAGAKRKRQTPLTKRQLFHARRLLRQYTARPVKPSAISCLAGELRMAPARLQSWFDGKERERVSKLANLLGTPAPLLREALATCGTCGKQRCVSEVRMAARRGGRCCCVRTESTAWMRGARE